MKLGALGAELERFLFARTVEVQWFHRVVAQLIYLGLLWRPYLSAVHAIYDFIVLPGWQPLWPSVRFEVVLLLGLLPYIRSDQARTHLPSLSGARRSGAG